MTKGQEPKPGGPSLLGKVVRQTSWSALQQVGVKGIRFLVYLGFARLLLPRHFGLVAEAAIITALLRTGAHMGLKTALVQQEAVDDTDLSTAVWASLALGALILPIALALGPVAKAIFDQPLLVELVPALALASVFTTFGIVPQAVLERKLDFRSLSLVRLGAGIAGGGIGLGLAVAGLGVWSLVVHSVVVAAVTSAGVWWRARPPLQPDFSWFRLRRLIRFGSAYTGEQFLNTVSRRADDFVIGVFLGDSALGIYRIAYIALEALTGVLGRAANAVALPVFSRAGDETHLLRGRFLQAVEIAVLVALPAWSGFAIVADTAVPMLFGEQWIDAVPTVRVLAAVGFGHSVLLLNASAMYALGRSDLQLRLAALYALVNVIGFTIGVRWGITGVAAALALETYLTAPVELTLLQKLIDLRWRPYLEKFWRPLIATGAMVIGLVGLRRTGFEGSAVTLLVSIAGGAFLYVVALTVIDRAYVRRLVHRFGSALTS